MYSDFLSTHPIVLFITNAKINICLGWYNFFQSKRLSIKYAMLDTLKGCFGSYKVSFVLFTHLQFFSRLNLVHYIQ